MPRDFGVLGTRLRGHDDANEEHEGASKQNKRTRPIGSGACSTLEDVTRRLVLSGGRVRTLAPRDYPIGTGAHGHRLGAADVVMAALGLGSSGAGDDARRQDEGPSFGDVRIAAGRCRPRKPGDLRAQHRGD